MRSLRGNDRSDRRPRTTERRSTANGRADHGFCVRPHRSDDALALRRLAALDSAEVPSGALLVAEVRGELWAAVAVASGVAVADPFRPTAELVRLLRLRAEQLRREDERPVERAGRTWLAARWWRGAPSA